MKRYRITYVSFVNGNNGEEWKESSSGTMGTYNTLEEMFKVMDAEIEHYKAYYDNVEIKNSYEECVITYTSQLFKTSRQEVKIYKLLEFDLDKYTKGSR